MKNSLTAAQSQLLAGQLIDESVPLCNMALACTIQEAINPEIMIQAWDIVAESSDALRIRLHIEEHHITQSSGHAWPAIEILDFSQYEAPQIEAQQWMQKATSTALAPTSVLGQVRLIKLDISKWVFYCNLHHVICDASSFSALWNSLSTTYKKIESTGDAKLIEPIENGKFLEHVKRLNQSSTHEQMTKPDYLQNIQKTELPAPFGRSPDRVDTESTRHSVSFSEERVQAFDKMVNMPQIRGFTSSIGQCNVLVSLLAILLNRIGGGTQQTIGLPLPQRQHVDHKNTLGLFVEVLPVQIDIKESDSFEAVISRVRVAFLDVLKSCSAGDCSFIGNHEIPAVLNYINAALGDFDDRKTSVEWLHSGHIDSVHRIRVQVQDWDGSGNIILAFDFNDAVFNKTQCLQTINAFWQLFDAMAEDLSCPIGSVAISEPKVIEQIQKQGNKFQKYSVLSQILETIQASGSKPAIAQDEEIISYSELGQRIFELSEKLRVMGVVSGARVVVHLHRDIRLPQILLAIHACDAVYIPIDANQPAARVIDIVNSAKPVAVISSRDITIKHAVDCLLDVDDLFTTTLGVIDKDLWTEFVNRVDAQLGQNAYVMYTSGSTGAPKGVVISQAALANYCFWAAEAYGASQPINMPLFTPIGFDLTVTSLFLPLMTSGTLHVYNERKYSLVEALGEVIREDDVNVIKLTPAHLTLLNREDCQSNQSVERLILGGEDLTTEQASRTVSLFKQTVLIHNEYGPTESTVGCVVHTYNPTADLTGSVPIGRPVAGARLRILNSFGQDQVPGCGGELYISGPSLADGYWNQNELTEAVFVRLPPNQELFYQSGDKVREDEQGKLKYLRRMNEQIKVRGHRIEPAEIESVALKHPQVKSCIAVLVNPQSSVQRNDKKCIRCGLSSLVPGALLNEQGICSPCQNFNTYKDRVTSYFRPMQEFRDIVENANTPYQSKYDCIMLLSGGKDSSYALGQLVDMDLSVLALTLDNGYISQGAKDNIARLCNELNVDHRYATSASMNAIFLDSLQRHANVCNGCFKTIYTHALKLAAELSINCIVTGLSRGQFFETRLSEDWFTTSDFDIADMDDAIVAARKAYHRTPDAVSCSMDTEFLNNDDIFDKIQILDFYRYCDVDLSEMYEYLDSKLPWIRPNDTGRSTNCLINDAGIYVHQHERGFHNYANPYSWDVRLGHKDRSESLDELNDKIDEAAVFNQLEEIGYQLSDKKTSQIALYYELNDTISNNELKHWLVSRLPEWMIPTWFTELPSLPLNRNGKIDRLLLPVPIESPIVVAKSGVPRGFADGTTSNNGELSTLSPTTESEKLVARIWSRHLRIDHFGVDESFFALGGNSLMAIRIVSELNRAGFGCKPADIFDHPTVARLSTRISINKSNHSDIGGVEPIGSQSTSKSLGKNKAFSALSATQFDTLSKALSKKAEP